MCGSEEGTGHEMGKPRRLAFTSGFYLVTLKLHLKLQDLVALSPGRSVAPTLTVCPPR